VSQTCLLLRLKNTHRRKHRLIPQARATAVNHHWTQRTTRRQWSCH